MNEETPSFVFRETTPCVARAHSLIQFGSAEAYQGYPVGLADGGMFAESETPRPVGSLLRFEVRLPDANPLRGFGEVVWVRFQAQGVGRPPGMGIQFRHLDGNGREALMAYLMEMDSSSPAAEAGSTLVSAKPRVSSIDPSEALQEMAAAVSPVDDAAGGQPALGSPSVDEAPALDLDSSLLPSLPDEIDDGQPRIHRLGDSVPTPLEGVEELGPVADLGPAEPPELAVTPAPVAPAPVEVPSASRGPSPIAPPPRLGEEAGAAAPPPAVSPLPPPPAEPAAPERPPLVLQPPAPVEAPKPPVAAWGVDETGVSEPPTPFSPSSPADGALRPPDPMDGLAEETADGVSSLDDSLFSGPSRSRRKPLFAGLAVAAILLAGLAWWWSRGSGPDGSTEAPEELARIEASTQDLAPSDAAPMGDPERIEVPAGEDAAEIEPRPDTVSPPAAEASGTDGGGVEEEAVQAAAGSAPAAAAPQDDAASTEPVAIGRPARGLASVTWRQDADGTVFTIVGDGDFRPSDVTPARVGGSSPRVVLRFSGLREPFDPSSLRVGSREVRGLRTGLQSGGGLHVVFDLNDPRLGLLDLDIRGPRLTVRVGPSAP